MLDESIDSPTQLFTAAELARLAAYRAAVRAGFYNETASSLPHVPRADSVARSMPMDSNRVDGLLAAEFSVRPQPRGRTQLASDQQPLEVEVQRSAAYRRLALTILGLDAASLADALQHTSSRSSAAKVRSFQCGDRARQP
jgi:hypothetical protein